MDERAPQATNADELLAAFDKVRTAQDQIDVERERIREQLLASEPTWGPCLQCGHTWKSNNLRRRRFGKPPRMCPNCKSKYWYDPDYQPRDSQVPPAGKSAAGADTQTTRLPDSAPATPNAPTTSEMPPPPRFEPEDALNLMHESDKDKS